MTEFSLNYVEALASQLPAEEQQLLGQRLLTHSAENEEAPPQSVSPRRPGSAIGKFFILAEDEEHLADFHLKGVL